MMSLEDLHRAWSGFEEKASVCYQLGPFSIRFSALDASFAKELTRAFSHLPRSDRPPDLTVRIWNGPRLPPLNWKLIYSNGYRGYAQPPAYFHYFQPISALSAVDVAQNIAYFAVRETKTLPWWVYGSPMQVILHIWLREKGMQLTHCGAVVGKNRTVLLSGKGGSGKSTTVLACLHEGLGTLGEDYVLLSKERAYSVYQTAKWMRRTRVFFPGHEEHIVNKETADREKALVFLRDFFPSQMPLSSPARAIVSLSIGAAPRLEKSDWLTSLQSLLLSTAMQLPFSDGGTSELLREIIEPMDHYRLTLGPDLKANTALIRSLIE